MPPEQLREDITEGGLFGKLLRHGSWYLASSLIAKFTAILLLPVNTRLFSEAEYGAIATIDASVRLLAIFVSLYLDAAYTRYYHEYKHDDDALRRYTSTLFWFILIWGVIAILVALPTTGSLFPGVPLWPVIILAYFAPLLAQLGLLGSAYLQQNHRSRLQVSFNLANLFTQVASLLLLVGVFGLGLAGKYTGVFLGSCVVALLSVRILLREKLLGLTFSWPMLKESLIFSVPLIPNIAGGWISGFSDRLLLSWYGTYADTGIYSVGYSLGQGISVFSEAVFMVYGPMIFAMVKKDEGVGRRRIERFVPYFFIFMIWMALAMSLFATELVTILTPQSYSAAVQILPIVIFAYFLGSQYKVFTTLLSYRRRTLLISSGAILQAVVNLGANLVLIPRYGQQAAAWTTVASIGFYLIWMIGWSQRSFRLNLDYQRLAIAAVLGSIAAYVGLGLIPGLQTLWVPLFMKFLLLLTLAAAFWVTGCILPEDKAYLLRLASKLRQRGP